MVAAAWRRTPGFCLPVQQLSADPLQLPADGQLRPHQVYVIPAEAKDFTFTQTQYQVSTYAAYSVLSSLRTDSRKARAPSLDHGLPLRGRRAGSLATFLEISFSRPQIVDRPQGRHGCAVLAAAQHRRLLLRPASVLTLRAALAGLTDLVQPDLHIPHG
jgi:hypothetical protein